MGFTFHYVSIKTHCAQIIYNELRKFTFHYVKTIMHSVSHVFMIHLHSTMYLLKLVPVFASSALLRHLHSTMYLLKRVAACCYTGVVVFTFHYVSIKTLWLCAFGISDISFTFHYVSIKTRYLVRCPLLFLHLHSTMYLLKRFIVFSSLIITQIYIPLCIY